MLYIAEVKKQTKLFMGGTRTTLHLLACQQNDNRWSAIPREETVSTDDVTQAFGEGALVTVNLAANRQVQGKVELAGSRVANLLQGFSRQLEKTKGQEQEIEDWKESLGIQAKELNRRQSELEEAEEELEEKEQQLSQLEQERAEIQQLREQWESDRAELEGAWNQLRGEQQRLETLQEELQGKQGLSPEQTTSLRALVEQVESSIEATKTTLNPLQESRSLIQEKTTVIQSQWKTLDQERQQVEGKQNQARQLREQLTEIRQQFQKKQGDLLRSQQNLATVQSQLETKQQIVTYLGTQLQKQSEARDILSRLVINSPQLRIQQDVDIQSLEEMPIEQLEQEFNSLKKSFDDAVSFVRDQEEELDYQLQSVRDLEGQLETANNQEQANVKNELAEEQDRYRFLEKTLVGQRRNLMAREDILEQHKKILKRRSGDENEGEEVTKVDLSPIFNKIDSQRDYSEDEFHQVNEEIETLQVRLKELEEKVKQQQQECENTRVEMENSESKWLSIQREADELSTRVEVNGEILHQREEELQTIREQLEIMATEAQKINPKAQQNQLAQAQKLLDGLS